MAMGFTQDLGPAIVAWGGTDISYIFEEVRWTLTGENAEVFENIFGATPVDSVFLGYSACEVTVPASRIALATLATLLPGGSNSGGASGGVIVNATSSAVIAMYDNSLPLFVKPIAAGAAIANGKWLRLEHTYPTPNFEVIFDLGTQRVYGLTFKAHPDATTKRLWSMGKVATGTSY